MHEELIAQPRTPADADTDSIGLSGLFGFFGFFGLAQPERQDRPSHQIDYR
jgi:hypothetical protein